jgi:phenylacetate-CoA ligase
LLYNLLLEKIILPAADFLLGTTTVSTLNKFRKWQWLGKAEVEMLQRQKLTELLSHATNNIPFYRQLNTKADSDPYSWLRQFPVLKKPVIKENIDSFTAVPKQNLLSFSSSGSSGVQGVVYMNKKEHSISRGLQILWWEWAGYKPGKPLLQTGMTLKRGFVKGAKDFLFRTTYVSAFGMAEKDMVGVLNKFRKKKHAYLGGYASSLYVLAEIAKKNGIDDIRFESSISWGDKMFPHYRKRLEEVFSTKVFDTYGAGEMLNIAAQCENGTYHIMDPHVYVEIVDKEGNPVPDGQMGYVLVTRLDCYTMPLIRYYLGDIAQKSANPAPCSCGRNFSHLDRIVGRDTDIVYTPGGKSMIVHFFTAIFEFVPEIKQFRVIQRELSSIEIEFIRDKNFHEGVLKTVEARIHDHLGESFPIVFHEVNSIPATASGKPQIIQSFIK